MTEYHDPSNVVNPEHADHHIVTPKVYAIAKAMMGLKIFRLMNAAHTVMPVAISKAT